MGTAHTIPVLYDFASTICYVAHRVMARMADDLARLSAATRAAAARGVTGAPTFMLGIWPCGGIQEEATMRSLLARFVRRRGDTPTST